MMKLLRMRWNLICALGLCVFSPVSLPGLEVAHLDTRISTLTDQFNELMRIRRTRVPGYVLRRAEGIVIIREYQVAFFGGAKGGNGVALARDPVTRAWSPPAFIRLGEGSFGFQFGGHQISIILVIMDPEVMKKLADTHFRIGVDAAAAAGPVGVETDAKAGLPPVVVYSNSKGLYAGISIEGGLILPNKRANKVYHGGGKKVRVDAILYGDVGAITPAAERLISTVSKYELR